MKNVPLPAHFFVLYYPARPSNVTLATGIPEERCRRVNLGYLDPREIISSEWEHREAEGILVVRNAGEMLYRAKDVWWPGVKPSEPVLDLSEA